MCLLWGMNLVFISQKTTFFIVTAAKTSNLTLQYADSSSDEMHPPTVPPLTYCRAAHISSRAVPLCTQSPAELSKLRNTTPLARARSVAEKLHDYLTTLADRAQWGYISSSNLAAKETFVISLHSIGYCIKNRDYLGTLPTFRRRIERRSFSRNLPF
jgi:hypothetical protein